MRTIFVSDLSGTELDEDGRTVSFGYDGVSYEMDLSPQEAEEFASVMGRYTGVARRTGGRRAPSAPGSSRRDELAQIRRWAADNGHQVSERGRVPKDVEEAYHAAH